MTKESAFDLMKGKPTEADINAIKVALIMSFYHEAKSGNHERSFEFQKLLARELLTSISDMDNLSGALGAQHIIQNCTFVNPDKNQLPKDAVVVDTVEPQEDDDADKMDDENLNTKAAFHRKMRLVSILKDYHMTVITNQNVDFVDIDAVQKIEVLYAKEKGDAK